jgi:hypothetical protein
MGEGPPDVWGAHARGDERGSHADRFCGRPPIRRARGDDGAAVPRAGSLSR